MKVQTVPQEPLFRDRRPPRAPHLPWHTAPLAGTFAALFVLLLRLLGA